MSAEAYMQLPDKIKTFVETPITHKCDPYDTLVRATDINIQLIISHTNIEFKNLHPQTVCTVYLDTYLLLSFTPTQQFHTIKYHGKNPIIGSHVKPELHHQLFDGRTSSTIQIHCTHGTTIGDVYNYGFLPFGKNDVPIYT
jgi:hypothetical protein